MNLQQLRYVIEIVRHNNRLSSAADVLHTSQPGVSRQIQLLEAELGFEIFMRTRNRIIGLTEPGQRVFEIASRVAADVNALRSLKDDIASESSGTLTIATTHTQARYVLPCMIEAFIAAYPDVQLVLKQGTPEDVCSMVHSGEADLGIGADTQSILPNLVKLNCFSLPRSVVAKKGHPILEIENLTIEDVARYPIVTYDPRYAGRWRVMKAFKEAGLEPKVILSAIDADVCKTYVGMGLGIGILTTIAYDPVRDPDLGARDAKHLFEPGTVWITLRTNSYMRQYALDFIRMVAPHLTPTAVRHALQKAEPPAPPSGPPQGAGRYNGEALAAYAANGAVAERSA